MSIKAVTRSKWCQNWRNQSVKPLMIPPRTPFQSALLQWRAKGECLHSRVLKSLDSMTYSVFLKERPVGRFSKAMAYGPAEKSSSHGKTVTNRKGTSQLQHVKYGFKVLEIIIDLHIGFPINNIISLSLFLSLSLSLDSRTCAF